MMIEIKSFSKRFGSRIIFDNLSFSFPKKGVVAIVGESGSGKTTLLNAIAGLDFDYSGEITIDSTNLKELSDDSLRDYRIHHIGYVFQNFNLLNLDSVETNILVPFESVSNAFKKIKDRKISELTKLLDISKLKKQPVNKLSGGEKQRVAIARAMINSPKVILCDEPTGALDEKNSQQIYDILKKISGKSLIIIASHDYDGVSKIADQIIEVKDGNVNIKNSKKNREVEEVNYLENKRVVNKATLNLSFKIKHAFQKMKAKKYRSLITHAMLSLSLTGIGLSIILSSSVSNRIKDAFSSLINGNHIVMSLKQDSQNTFSNAYSAPIDKVNEIYEKYSYYIEGVGATYLVNFEDFFKDGNDIYVSSTAYKFDLPSLSTRSINDFRWLTGNDEMVMYPYNVASLSNDQVVLGLTYQEMTNLCFKLQIQRNFLSLGHYIHDNKMFITLEVANSDWQYDDEQIFEVKAITESNKSIFYHTNSLWNEEIFEAMMRLPSDDDDIHYFPWEMFKLYYFKTIDDPSEFLNSIFYDEEYSDYVFERTNNSYHPTLCSPNEICNERRVLIYLADKCSINPAHLKYISELDNDIKNYYYTSDFGYASYASNLLSGFSKNVFVSFDESKIASSIDADNEIKDSNIQIDLPDGVVEGNFLNGISGGLRFSSRFNKLIEGRTPNNLNEIVISKGLAKSLDEKGQGLGKYLYIAGEINEYMSSDDYLEKEYQTSKVVVVGIVDEDQNYLYHNSLWTIDFFRDKLGVSSFYLIPKAAVIELEQDVDASQIIIRFNKMFHEYNFSSPVNELSKSVKSTLNYANAILIGFSILSILISMLLLGTVVLLNILESKDEIRLLSIIGIKQKDINSLFVYQSLLQGLISFLFSAIELVVVDYVITKALGETMHTTLMYSFNFLPILVVFIVAIVLPYVTSLIIINILTKKKMKNIAKSNQNC